MSIHVSSCFPKEGPSASPLTVHISFTPEDNDPVYLRLVFGEDAVSTSVSLVDPHNDQWRLTGEAPPGFGSVSLYVEALSGDGELMSSTPCGTFTYWSSASSSTGKAPRLCRSLMRTRYPIARVSDDAQKPAIIDICTPIEEMCEDWSPAEKLAGRRLVSFSKMQVGRKLSIWCDAIPQESFDGGNHVISCIYRPETDSYWVTSIDVIFLMEYLVDSQFPVEEKNRIRRNIEGLKPVTVNKRPRGSGSFFQRIMDFPDPKPRNIEKDLKVFRWTSLRRALEIVIAKYVSLLPGVFLTLDRFLSPSLPSSAPRTPLPTQYSASQMKRIVFPHFLTLKRTRNKNACPILCFLTIISLQLPLILATCKLLRLLVHIHLYTRRNGYELDAPFLPNVRLPNLENLPFNDPKEPKLPSVEPFTDAPEVWAAGIPPLLRLTNEA